MKDTILETVVRSVLQMINNGGADSVELKEINGLTRVNEYVGLATYEHSSSLEALEDCQNAFWQIGGEIVGIGFYSPAEIRFAIRRESFWADVNKWLDKIGMTQDLNDMTEDQMEAIGETIAELAKARRWKRIIGD